MLVGMTHAFSLVLALSACGVGAPEETGDLPVTDTLFTVTLDTDLDTYRAGETVTATLRVIYHGNSPVRLVFSSSQRFDFRLLDERDAEVWAWSRGRAFAQMIGEMEMDPAHRELLYVERFGAPETPGRYRLLGEVTAMSARLAAVKTIVVSR